MSNCSSRTSSSSGITGRFWDCRSTSTSISSKRSSSSLKQTRTYWAISEGTTYESPLQQEELFSLRNSCHETLPSVHKAERERIDVPDVATLPRSSPNHTSERWADMSDDSGLPTLEAGSSSENTSIASLEEQSHLDPALTGPSQHSALEHLSHIISGQHNWHVTAPPATEPWMHLSALKAFSLQPAVTMSGNHPRSDGTPESNIYSLTSSLCTT